MIAIAPSGPNRVYFGSDGGIYRSDDAGLTWASLNNTTYRATQFRAWRCTPSDREFMIGGTQDNGTEFKRADGTWTRADVRRRRLRAIIDQNAPGRHERRSCITRTSTRRTRWRYGARHQRGQRHRGSWLGAAAGSAASCRTA